MTSVKNYLIEKRWAFLAVFLGVMLGFISALICVAYNLVIFGFNIMYIVSPLLAGFVETYIARKKYGKSTGALSALLTFIIINGYGWFSPGWLFPKEPATLSLITIIAIILTLQAAFPTLINYILFVVVVGTLVRVIESLVNLPSKIQRKPPEVQEEAEIKVPSADEIFLDELTMPLVSVPDVDGGKIKKYVGLVVGEAVAEGKESKGRFSGILKMIQPIKLDDLNLGDARKIALSRMLEKAESMGANAVVEVLLDYLSMGGLQGSATIVTATGTAVIVGEETPVKVKVFKEDKKSPVSENKSLMAEKISVSSVGEEIPAGENISLMDKIKGKLRGKKSKIDLSHEESQLTPEKGHPSTEDWEIMGKNDLEEIGKRYSSVSRDVKLEKRFEKQRKYTNKKWDEVEHRLKKLEL